MIDRLVLDRVAEGLNGGCGVLCAARSGPPRIGKPPRIALVVMVEIDDLRLERLHTLGGGNRTHAVDRQIHRHEGHVDIAERLDGGDALPHPGKKDPSPPKRDDIAVRLAHRMQGPSGRQVVGRDRFHRDPGEDARLAVRQHAAVSKPGLCRRCQHDRRARLTQLLDRLWIQMVTRVIGHEDEIGRFGLRQVSGAPRIDVNHRAGMLHLDARVDDWCEDDIAALGTDLVRRLRRQRHAAQQQCRGRNGQAHV